MFRFVLSFFLIFFIFSSLKSQTYTPDANGVLYVKKGNTGNGQSWNSAVGELADALKDAKTNPKIKQIWVAEGTYYPMYSPADNNFGKDSGRINSFLMVKNVQVYGSFAGTETSITQRDTSNFTHKTILNGSISNQDTSYQVLHVVLSAGDVGNAKIDGFDITGGYFNYIDSLSVLYNDPITVNGQTRIYRSLGAGIFNYNSSLGISNCIVENNTSFQGGGIYYDSPQSDGYIYKVQILNNKSLRAGGLLLAAPIHCDLLTVNKNQVSLEGAGVYITASATLTNALITYNSCITNGSGIYVYQTSPTIINCTIMNNNRDGIYNRENSKTNVYNCIIWNNNKGITNYDVLSTQHSVIYVSHSLIQSTGGSSNWNSTTNKDLGGNLDQDPDMGDNYQLNPFSLAIDAGENDLFSNLTSDVKDIVGNPRVFDIQDNGIIDMGAIETQHKKTGSIVYVKKGSTGYGSSWDDAVGDLADAMAGAQKNTVIKEIWVAKGTYKPKFGTGSNILKDNKQQNSFQLIKDLHVYGGFDGTESAVNERKDSTAENNATILSGDIGVEGDSSDNVYNVVFAVGDVGSAELNGVTITKGVGNGFFEYDYTPYDGDTKTALQNNLGGGAFLYNTNATFKNVNFIHNWAIGRNNISVNGYGGGISVLDHSNISIVNSQISDNIALTRGGGIYIENSNVSLLNSLINNNTALGYGGGITMIYNSNLNIVNSTIVNNTANSGGGAIYYLSPITIKNSIFYGNSGNFYLPSGFTASNPVISNSLIQGSGGSSNWENSTLTDGGGNIDTDPLFVSLDDYHLQAKSPAVDAGNNSYFTGLSSSSTDLDGLSRDNNSIIDMGAYEYHIPTALPVQLLDFKAINRETSILLDWNTASEINNSGFEIQRSVDGKTFQTLGFEKGNGTTNIPQSYSFKDISPWNGNNYYRLKQIDFDGKFTYSNILFIYYNGNNTAIKLYPNPASDFIHLSGLNSSQITIYSLQGQILISNYITQSPATINIQSLPSGIYIWKSGIHSGKFIKK